MMKRLRVPVLAVGMFAVATMLAAQESPAIALGNIGSGVRDVVVGDFDGDGTPESALAAYGEDAILFAGRSAAGFVEPLRGAYHDDPDARRRFTGAPRLRREPAINFDWGYQAPFESGFQSDTFSVRWTGRIRVPKSGTYTFITETDDGVRLSIDGRLVVDQWRDMAPTRHQADVRLTAGRAHTLRMDYYENGGGAVARLLWKPPGGEEAIIPAAGRFSLRGRREAGLGPVSLAAGDFNGDGRVDLAAANYNLSGTITEFHAEERSTWPIFKRRLGAGRDPFRLIAGDWNNDGTDGLAVAHKGDRTVLFYETGERTATYRLPCRPLDLTAIPGAKRADTAAVLCRADKTGAVEVRLLDGTGKPVSGARVDTVPAGYVAGRMSAADLNDDGVPELILGLAAQSKGGAVVVLNGKDRRLLSHWKLDFAVEMITVGNVLRERGLEIIAFGGGEGRILRGRKSSGSFQYAGNIRALTAADFDGDGRDEIMGVYESARGPARLILWTEFQ